MKLSTRISLGFAALMMIALALGGTAVWNMFAVKRGTTLLSRETVPAVTLVNQIERDSLQTMYQMRGYAFTDQENFLSEGRKLIAAVKQGLADAKALAAESVTLDDVRQNCERALAKMSEYEQLMNDTVARTQAMGKNRETMNLAAQRYAEMCNGFFDAQMKALAEETRASLTSAAGDNRAEQEKQATERLTKIANANDILELGGVIRVGNWKAQLERDPKFYEQTVQKFDEVFRKLAAVRAMTRRAEDLGVIDNCEAAAKAYQGAMKEFLVNWLAREEITRKRGEAATAVLAEAKAAALDGMKDTTDASNNAASSLSTASTILIIGLGVALVIGFVLAFFITRSITRPVIRIADVLTGGAQQTSSAAGQVSASSQTLAQGASEQAAALEETTSALEEMSSMTRKNADTAQQAASLSGEAQKAATQGNQAMAKMSSAISEIQKSASETAKIIKVIDEIAFQTNLLALNAAVEAARAGEAGKGFAVVAEEVRNLAMRSAEAAKNTASMIEESVNAAKNGVAISADVAKMLQEITEAATKVNSLIGEIAAASQEQSQGIEQVNKAVGQMDKVTQSNAANAEESAAAAEELSSQAEQVAAIVRELTALVNGAKASAGSEPASAGASHAATRSTSHGHSTPHRPASAPHARAEQRIPLGDSARDDFTEFGKAA